MANIESKVILEKDIRNVLKSLLSLQGKNQENDRYFQGGVVYANSWFTPYSWENRMWPRNESPTTALEAIDCLESACKKGYTEKALISIETGFSTANRDIVEYRIPKEKISEVAELLKEK